VSVSYLFLLGRVLYGGFFDRVTFPKNVALLGAGLMLLIVPQPWPLGVDAAMSAQQPAQGPPPMVKENAVVKVSPHAYVIPDNSVSLVPNVGIIVGNTATMVIDTGLGPRNAQTILREVAKISRNTDLYLVTTHFHPEHAAGSAAFPPGAKFVVARTQQQDLDELGLTTNATFASRSAIAAELLKDVLFRRPDVLFDYEHAIDLGGVRVRLLALGSTHTRGDTVAFVEGDRVLFAGDIVFNRAFLAFGQYSSGQTWLAVLDQLGSLNPATIVPSHGPMGDGSLIGQQRDVLKALQSRARELREQGKTAEQAAQTLVSEFQMKYPNWTGPNRVGAAVRSFYAEM
jgi:glyoxylase-like metal-dependent hydrolase (beta-lactamase superfamily II)